MRAPYTYRAKQARTEDDRKTKEMKKKRNYERKNDAFKELLYMLREPRLVIGQQHTGFLVWYILVCVAMHLCGLSHCHNDLIGP